MPNGSRRFAVTQYNYDDEWIKRIQDSDLFHKWVWQEEKAPTTGRLHLQCFFHTKARITFAKLKQRFHLDHVEQAKGSELKNFEYCTKEHTATGRYQMQMQGSVWNLKTKTGLKRKKMLDACADIANGKTERYIAQTYPEIFLRHSNGVPSLIKHHKPSPSPTRPITVIALLGPTGTGKSHWARQLAHYQRLSIYSKMIQKAGETMWFQGYTGQDILLLDDFDAGQIEYRTLLTYLDVYAVKGQIKGGDVDLTYNTVIITSNTLPRQWYPNEEISPLMRRITITHQCPTPYAVSYIDYKAPLRHAPAVAFIDPPAMQDIKRDVMVGMEEAALDGAEFHNPAFYETPGEEEPGALACLEDISDIINTSPTSGVSRVLSHTEPSWESEATSEWPSLSDSDFPETVPLEDSVYYSPSSEEEFNRHREIARLAYLGMAETQDILS